MVPPPSPSPTWSPFVMDGVTYDLSHLDTFDYVFVQAAAKGDPERHFAVTVHFGHHTFTEGVKVGDDPTHLYPSRSDPRTFNLDRWELSFQLPDLVQGLMSRQVSHTGHQNFFVIELTTLSGVQVEYEVYFKVYLNAAKRLQLMVTSAFPRDPQRLDSRAARRPMRLALILHNTRIGKPINPPPTTGRRR